MLGFKQATLTPSMGWAAMHIFVLEMDLTRAVAPEVQFIFELMKGKGKKHTAERSGMADLSKLVPEVPWKGVAEILQPLAVAALLVMEGMSTSCRVQVLLAVLVALLLPRRLSRE